MVNADSFIAFACHHSDIFIMPRLLRTCMVREPEVTDRDRIWNQILEQDGSFNLDDIHPAYPGGPSEETAASVLAAAMGLGVVECGVEYGGLVHRLVER